MRKITKNLGHIDPSSAFYDQFVANKNARREYYMRFGYSRKMEKCTACNGSGYYDHNGSPKCGGCDGTGKCRE